MKILFISYLQTVIEDFCMNDIRYACGFSYNENIKIEKINNIIGNDKKIVFDVEVRKAYSRDIYYNHCELVIDKEVKSFKVKVSGESLLLEKLEDGIEYDCNLVPKKVSEEIIMRILTKQYKNVAYKPMITDIEKIISNYGLVVNYDYELIEAKSEMIFEDSEYKTKDGFVNVSRGMILVDKNLEKREGKEVVRFKLGHEFSHFILHDNYFKIKKLVEKYHTLNKKPDSVRVERQADSMSIGLLIPNISVREYVLDLYNKHNFLYGDNKNKALKNIINDIAKTYNVSHYAASIKFESLGLFIDRMKPSNRYKTYITKEKAKELYNTSYIFRAIYDSNKFLYIDSQFVLNLEKYIQNNKITPYAREHKKECMISFKRYKGYDKRHNSHSLSYNPLNDTVYITIKGNEQVLRNADLFDFDELKKESEFVGIVEGNVGLTIKNIRENKKRSYGSIESETSVRKGDIISIENNISVKNAPIKIALICKALDVPRSITEKIIRMSGENFYTYWNGRLLKELLDKGYDEPMEVFIKRTNDIKGIAETIDKAYIESKKEKK